MLRGANGATSLLFWVILMGGCGSSSSLTLCDPFEDACGADERCAPVFSFDIGDEVVGADYFCVLEGQVAEGGLCRGVSTGDDESGNELVTDDCAAGLFCATLGTERRCRALCDGDRAGCNAAEFCRGISMEPLLAVCIPADNCDLLEQDCEEGDGCYATTGSDGRLLSHCFEFLPPPRGAGEVGAPCDFTGDCAPGSDCFSDPSDPNQFVCRQFCEPRTSESTCPTGSACAAMSSGSESQTVPGLCE